MVDKSEILHLPQLGSSSLIRSEAHSSLIARGRRDIYSLALLTAPPSLAAAMLNGKWGFIDNTGKFIIEPMFAEVGGFSAGLASASISGKSGSGYIDKLGKFVVEPQFDYAARFIEGYARVAIFREELDRYEWGYVHRDTLGYVREGWCESYESDVMYRDISYEEETQEASEGLRPVCHGWSYGYQNEMGTWVIEPQFEMAGRFSEGLAPVRVGGCYGVINRHIEYIVEPQYDNLWSYSEGLAAFRLNGKYGFIDRTGRRIIEAQFDDCSWQFDKGLACAGNDQDYGIIDVTGRFIGSHRFKKIGIYSQGLARVQNRHGRWGFIDRQGEIAIQLQFENVESFHLVDA